MEEELDLLKSFHAFQERERLLSRSKLSIFDLSECSKIKILNTMH